MDIFKTILLEAKEFDLSKIERDLWSELIHKEQDAVDIHFDLENNERKGDVKEVELGIKYPSGDPIKVLAQLYSAGGDWEDSVGYFKCQLIPIDAMFIVIPGPEVNKNLVKRDKGYSPSTQDDKVEEPVAVGDIEKDLWDGLKDELKTRLAEEASDVWEPDYKAMRLHISYPK